MRGRRSSRRVDGIGPAPCELVFVGEGPGYHEDRRGIPFCGAAGSILDDGLDRCRLTRADAFITNLTRYHIVHNLDPTDAEIASDAPLLEAELARVRPRLVVTLGRFSARYFLPAHDDVTMDRYHGFLHDVPGRPFRVFTAYHPAAGLHDTDQMALVLWDFDRLRQVLDGALGPHVVRADPPRIVSIAHVAAWAEAARASRLPYDAGLDTEFDSADPTGRPWGLSLAVTPGEACVVRADDAPGLALARDVLLGARHIYLHNVMADLPVLDALGIPLAPHLDPAASPRVLDTMMMVWHDGIHPQGLKDLAWRLLGIAMTSFTDTLAPVQALMSYEYLTAVQDAGPWRRQDLRVTWAKAADGTETMKVGRPWGMDQRLTRLLTDAAANPDTNLLERWTHIDPEYRDEVEVDAGFGPMPVASVFDIDEATATRYAAQDADVTLRLGPRLLTHAVSERLIDVLDGDLPAVPLFARMQQVGLPCDVPYLERLSTELRARCDHLQADLEALVGHPINPRSPDQVALLLFDELGLAPHTTTKTGKPSTAKKALAPYRDTSPHAKLILEFKELAKIDDAFARNIPKWVVPNRAGEPRCQAQWRVTRVKTGRPATHSPNILAIPSRTAEGRRVREGFRAAPGRLLGAWDQCLVPGTRVLTADLRHVPIETLRVGDRVVGIDEYPIGDHRDRELRIATIEAVGRRRLPCREFWCSNGAHITASREHPWLARGDQASGWSWIATWGLQLGDEIRSLDPDEVVTVEGVADTFPGPAHVDCREEVVTLQTSTRTFVAEGLITHNSQLEMRIAAHRSCDPLLLEVYGRDAATHEPWERDIHIQVAALVYGCHPRDVKKAWRTAMKAVGFGILMGMTKHGLYDQMRLYGVTDTTPEDCAQLIRDWLGVYTGIRDYQLQMRAEARRRGEIRDLFDRRYRLPGIWSRHAGVREEAERQSHALDIQGSAQGLFKRIMARLWRETLPAFWADGQYLEPLIQLHDEMIMEFDEGIADAVHAAMVDVMTNTVGLIVPLESSGDVGPTWGGLEK